VRIVWSPSALREIERATDYLMDFNPRAAKELAEGLVLAGDSLAHFPHRGRRVPNTDMRERYRIVRDDVVRILRVRHISRRPTTP
jgi:plasmid stabilization system protein ParE